jgi:hypothetical protein
MTDGPPTNAARDEPPVWDDVHSLITDLCASRASFETATSAESSISQYEPGVRLMLQTERGSKWVAVEDVRGCWETLERLGTVIREDLLEPGRCSAFMFALFAQVDGVDADADAADASRAVLRLR